MDPITIDATTQILELINAGGVSALLVILIIMFVRGDIIPRKVYEKIMRSMLVKISADIIASVSVMMKDQQTFTTRKIDELSKRFNHIEEAIEDSRKTTI